MATATLERRVIFEYLRPDELDALSGSAETLCFKAGDTVYESGAKADYLYVVLSGQVALRLPGKKGVNILIDQVTCGDIFGSCVACTMDYYTLSAQCTADSRLLRIEAAALKELLDKDLRMGYAIQCEISQIYFKKYIETMEKLQAVVKNIPIESSE